MHVVDTSHTPSLYGTIFYLLSPSPPFRIANLSPKLCISEVEVEIAISERWVVDDCRLHHSGRVNTLGWCKSSSRSRTPSHIGRCALQYVTGLVADEGANLAIISFGQVVVAAL